MNSPPFAWPYSVAGMPGPPVATPPPPEAFPLPQVQPPPPPQPDGHLSSPPDVDLDSPQSLMADGSDLPLHDVTTLRFFYNLGVNVFNTVRKATQSPVLAMHDQSSSQVDGLSFSANHGGRARVAAAAQEGADCACARARGAGGRLPAAYAALLLARTRRGAGWQRGGWRPGNAWASVAMHATTAGVFSRWRSLCAPSRVHAATATQPLATVCHHLLVYKWQSAFCVELCCMSWIIH